MGECWVSCGAFPPVECWVSSCGPEGQVQSPPRGYKHPVSPFMLPHTCSIPDTPFPLPQFFRLTSASLRLKSTPPTSQGQQRYPKPIIHLPRGPLWPAWRASPHSTSVPAIAPACHPPAGFGCRLGVGCWTLEPLHGPSKALPRCISGLPGSACSSIKWAVGDAVGSCM